MFVVGTGPTELHAHINLDQRAAEILGDSRLPALTVLDTTQHQGEWSIVARLRNGPAGP